MSHILKHDGHYFRIEIAELIGADIPNSVYAVWCSDAFRKLKDSPGQACSRFVTGSPFANRAEALRQAQDWIKLHWDAQQATRANRPAELGRLVYTVWLFKGEASSEHHFQEFLEARLFANAAEKEAGITKVGITNNESPEYLTVWEKS